MPTTTATRSSTPTAPDPSSERLAANLRAIAAFRPDLAEKITNTEPDHSIEFALAPDGALTATRAGRALASKRRPREEGARVAEKIDAREHAVLVALGFGLGHHLRPLAEKLGASGLLCVFEPDLPLLRAVLERTDCTAWIKQTNLVLFDDPADAAAISRIAQHREGVFALGVRFVEHGPSSARLGESAARFSEAFASAVAAVRTSVVTTMVQTQVTVRNALMNAEHYATRGSSNEGIADLKDLCAGRPAIVVSAGPSLRRNIHLLKDPSVRDKCVIIAVQTVLKTLLDEGIKPHFVCALDYHEISKRFYEGLTAADVESVTLVAEPKVNPAVLDAYPGPVRTPADENLDLLLPQELTGERAPIRAGSTVAHLCYYLARHLGCDPVILTGQDLAFTDNVYYGQGAAIHHVWAPELGPFRTLETLEWERIARSKRSLRALKDHEGNPVYTDEQMATYLAQLERSFAEDREQGLRILDATEGGAAKNHTETTTLAEALDRFAGADAPDLPNIPIPERRPLSAATRRALKNRLTDVRKQAGRVSVLCEKSERLLDRLKELAPDQTRMNKVISELHDLRAETKDLRPGYDLVQKINQTGAFNRARADRDMNLAGLSPEERQLRQIDRDAVNVRWLRDATTEVARLLDSAAAALEGAPKITTSTPRVETTESPRALKTAAVIFADAEFDSLTRPRTLTNETLSAILARIAECDTLDDVILLTNDDTLQPTIPANLNLTREPLDLDALRESRRAVAAARVWNPHAWRGGLAGATLYDELYETETLARVARDHALDTALLVGDDWTTLDPALTDQITQRRAEDPDRHRIVFTQAAPGRAPIALSREIIEEFAAAADHAKPWATIAGVLSYMPFNPLADPIAKALCVNIDASVRDEPRWQETQLPEHLIIELAAKDNTDHLSSEEWQSLLRNAASAFPNACVTFAGTADPLTQPNALDIITTARAAAFSYIHVRTSPQNNRDQLLALAQTVDVISLDFDAPDSRDAIENTEALLTARARVSRHDLPYIVPRLTRRAETSQAIEAFYDHWLMKAGAAVIDPNHQDSSESNPNDRFAPLTPPTLAQDRARNQTLFINAQGEATTGFTDKHPGKPVTTALTADLTQLWNAVRAARS